MRLLQIILFLAVLTGIFAMIQISFPYFFSNTNTRFLNSKWSVQHLMIWQIGFKIHVFSAVFVLIFGFFQFLDFIRLKFKLIHRLSGYLYFILVVLVSGPGGLIMGIYGNGGQLAKISFVISAILWMLTTILAIKSIKARNIKQHLYWTSLSYGLCLSAITLRFYVLVLPQFFHLSSSNMYALVAWLSWIPNLIIAHYYAKNQQFNLQK